MENHLRKCLKHARESNFISVPQAAYWAGVKDRTWRAYESAFDSSSRNPTRRSLWCFFHRAGIAIPPELKDYIFKSDSGQTLSITAYKGGVGKSPITVDVAACLVRRGFKVAIITNDIVYTCKIEKGDRPEPGSLVSQISFYNDLDILFSNSEIKKLEKELRHNRLHTPASTIDLRPLIYSELSEKLDRKRNAKKTYEELRRTYDYILFDMNRSLEKIRDIVDLMVLVLDSNCQQSIDSAENFITNFKHLLKKKKNPLLFGLITRCDVGGRSRELEEYVGDHVEISEEIAMELNQSKADEKEKRERILFNITKLGIPLLKSKFTSAHEIVTQDYNRGRSLWTGFSYFHSVLDVAPNSYAAAEVNHLVDELFELRM
ncbi:MULTISPECIES: AAA family ATPase [Pseudomonas]|uniref:AAA family ATPase n=1 Tax=Pseudomonas nitroreducens TaxID=46680 RepID=UPI001E5A4FC1|nr:MULTISPECIES: AAA family ATPase [Pseudomonas]MCE4071523.1 AAA family ATPase [Pseudomonas nitritireducens]MCE4081299.1 AAA family ATPase [Pseudomonas nitroreducens]